MIYLWFILIEIISLSRQGRCCLGFMGYDAHQYTCRGIYNLHQGVDCDYVGGVSQLHLILYLESTLCLQRISTIESMGVFWFHLIHPAVCSAWVHVFILCANISHTVCRAAVTVFAQVYLYTTGPLMDIAVMLYCNKQGYGQGWSQKHLTAKWLLNVLHVFYWKYKVIHI